ncbi:hypothetical protein GCM10017772_21880 [Promicromonospora soli]|uniref:Uncharacterized protein n=1 Tax=Promicromonospora soli TaxID=2035533 RepID=A0A919FTN9_9MICO|nr:hypothetical protein GCM10017772_21880 [Promicromonospora soli]
MRGCRATCTKVRRSLFGSASITLGSGVLGALTGITSTVTALGGVRRTDQGDDLYI